MRNTRDFLHKTAMDHVAKRIKSDRDLVGAYLIGSVLSDEPLIGGTTDIDLVIIHVGEPKVKREIIRVNDEVHLDVVHHGESVYQQPRTLRAEAWLGPAIQNHPVLLYDVRHWFEFTQASAGSQFYRPDHILARARTLSDKARSIWTELNEGRPIYVKKVRKFMEAVECAANAAASLTGAPLTRRCFLQEFPDRCNEIGASGLVTSLVNLLDLQNLTAENISSMLPVWEKAFRSAGEQAETSPDLHPLRLDYYSKAIQAHLEDGEVLAAAYPMFYTWAKAISYLYATSPEYISWFDTLKEMGLGKDQFTEKLKALDAYLDHVDEVMEDWANRYGA